jgi:hypothetical protein
MQAAIQRTVSGDSDAAYDGPGSSGTAISGSSRSRTFHACHGHGAAASSSNVIG